MKRTILPLSGLIAACLLAGCASKPATTAETKTAPKQQQQEEYVSQTSVGSWIPKKVKKSQAKTSDQESQEAQEAMRELQQRGNAQPPKGN